MQDYFLRFTLDSFSQIGFGFDTASTCAESNRFATAFDYVQSRCFNRMDYGVFWPWIAPADDKFKSHLKYMDDVVYACIAKAKAKSREELLAKQALEPDLLTQTLLDMTGQKGERAYKRKCHAMRVCVIHTTHSSAFMCLPFWLPQTSPVVRTRPTARWTSATQ